MSIAPGTISALSTAGTDNTDTEFEFVMLDGDLSQMGTIGNMLRKAGFDIRHKDVYPVVQSDEIKPALTYLFENKVAGWWNQKDSMLKYGVCTLEEFNQQLGRK